MQTDKLNHAFTEDYFSSVLTLPDNCLPCKTTTRSAHTPFLLETKTGRVYLIKMGRYFETIIKLRNQSYEKLEEVVSLACGEQFTNIVTDNRVNEELTSVIDVINEFVGFASTFCDHVNLCRGLFTRRYKGLETPASISCQIENSRTLLEIHIEKSKRLNKEMKAYFKHALNVINQETTNLITIFRNNPSFGLGPLYQSTRIRLKAQRLSNNGQHGILLDFLKSPVLDNQQIVFTLEGNNSMIYSCAIDIKEGKVYINGIPAYQPIKTFISHLMQVIKQTDNLTLFYTGEDKHIRDNYYESGSCLYGVLKEMSDAFSANKIDSCSGVVRFLTPEEQVWCFLDMFIAASLYPFTPAYKGYLLKADDRPDLKEKYSNEIKVGTFIHNFGITAKLSEFFGDESIMKKETK